jgi:hypothetical protein
MFEKEALLDIFAFVMAVASVWFLQWTTTDLVWSLWLSSLVIGYLTILSTIAGPVYIGVRAILHDQFPAKHRLKAVTGGSLLAIFFLGFFSLHFCGFHAMHAGFLSLFFPIQGVGENVFFDAFMNPLLLWSNAFQYIIPYYGMFLIPMIIAERKYVFASIIKSVRAVQSTVGKQKSDQMIQSEDRMEKLDKFMKSGEERKKMLKDPFSRPYANVIRMHFMIFLFAAFHMLKVDSFVVYVAVCGVYFFPWYLFKKSELPVISS